MKKLSVLLPFIAVISLWCSEQFFPTEYVPVSYILNSSRNIEIANGIAKISAGHQTGILKTEITHTNLSDLTGFSVRIVGEIPDGCKVLLRIFWSYDGKNWLGPIDDWEVEPNDDEGPIDGYLYANPYYTAKPPARYYKAELHLFGSDGKSPVLGQFEFVFMNCGWTNHPITAVSPTVDEECPMPSIVPRGPDGWDCPIPDTFASGVPIYYDYVTHITIHHTAGATSTPPDPCAQMRNIWNYHVYTRGWNDIGYNFVLDHLGNIYHGRWNADLENFNVRGAHVSYHNSYTMGFSIMGNFEEDTLCYATLPAIYSLISWKCDQYDIDPYGSGWNGDGEHRYFVPTILGHRDWPDASTACPGANIYPLIPSIRDSVAARLSGSAIIVDNGDGEFTDGGTWYEGTYNPSSGWENDYEYCSSGGELDWAHWTPNLPEYGEYDVYMWWYAGSNRCNNVLVRIHGISDDTVFVSQKGTGSDWHYLGRFIFDAGSSGFVGINDETATDGDVVIADAVKWILINPLNISAKAEQKNKIEIAASPNPFNSSIKIDVNNSSISKAELQIKIYDLRGNIVASSTKTPFIWHPKKSNYSGIYLIRAFYNHHSTSRKVVFLK
ncbi:N-acetylmuramoyl-L-alanine amidase [bacterium]|nr:N-acetylmuramoyl-L-alanine amidase [bacterium]